jgi:hypothetical protein
MPLELKQGEKLALESFPEAAQEFCRFVNQYSPDQSQAFIQELFARLARVCEVANRLPWVDPATHDVKINQDEIQSHVDECFKLSKRLRRAFGRFDSYWDVFDPTQKEQPVNGSLANDIAEIYLDLKEALSLLRNGSDLSDVHWQWRFDFHSHWGRHAGSALRALLRISDLT